MSEYHDRGRLQLERAHGYESRLRWQQPIYGDNAGMLEGGTNAECSPTSEEVIQENVDWLHNYLDSVEQQAIERRGINLFRRGHLSHQADIYVDKHSGMILEIDYVDGALNHEVVNAEDSVQLTIEVSIDRNSINRNGNGFPRHQLYISRPVYERDNIDYKIEDKLSPNAIKNLEMTLEHCRNISEKN